MPKPASRPQRPQPTRPNRPLDLTMTDMANGGSAVAWHDNRPIFVPYTIPGERVRARIVEDKGRFARAEGLELLEASADRVYPVCPHFGPGKCGRCQWQHISYEAQLLLKQDVLADQLARLAGLDDAPIEPSIPSPERWYYNYHMTLMPTADGRFGFQAADGDGIFPISECHIMHGDLLDLFHQLDLDPAGITRLRLQLGTDGARMLILSTDNDLAPELEADMPASVNLLLSDNEPVNLIGDSHSRYTVGETTFRVTAGSAFRPNVSQLPNLASAALRLLDLQGGEAVLDLYAGVGFFSAFLAPVAGLVTLVESYPPAVTDADDNLAAFDNVDVFEGAVGEVLPTLEERYDVAVVDPPTNGLTDDIVAALAELDVHKVMYVSGDPASLARDCKRLARHGFRLVVAQPIDLSPQTYYVDTLALFTR
jgi:tRNA/tmRNA/rRNA uracil-C5-methylase (TrmA/RlmC/RlmD family)